MRGGTNTYGLALQVQHPVHSGAREPPATPFTHTPMKIQALAIPFLSLVCALPLACKATEGHDRAESTADRVVDVGAAAGQTQLHLDKTLDALAQLEATRNQDPKPGYKEFTGSYDNFASELATLVKRRDSLRTTAESWFSEYEKQNRSIQDEDLRKTGEKRLSGFREQIADTSKQVDEILKNANAVDGRLKDLHTYLSNDLTPDGIDAVSGRISDLSKDGRKVAARLGDLSKSSETLAGKLRAARKPAQPAQ